MDLGWAGIADGSGVSMVGVGSFGSLGDWEEGGRQKVDLGRGGICALVGF